MITLEDIKLNDLINEICNAQAYKEDLFSEDGEPITYSLEEKETVCQHIRDHFGKMSYMIPAEYDETLTLDLYVIEPDENQDFYTIVTVGMGSMLMNVPREYADGEISRAELMICLPKDWKIEGKGRKWSWPMYFLRQFAKLPILENSWLGVGHVVPIHIPLAENTAQSGFLLLEPQDKPLESFSCRLSDGSNVNFYQLIPLYEEEIKFEYEHGMEALLERMADVNHVVNVERINSCSEGSVLM
ncbi:MAG: suppressor of fused domain protein [Firmicutes bacterium]|nr:suppressor of fused domain protein [Bacillota bacterium]